MVQSDRHRCSTRKCWSSGPKRQASSAPLENNISPGNDGLSTSLYIILNTDILGDRNKIWPDYVSAPEKYPRK